MFVGKRAVEAEVAVGDVRAAFALRAELEVFERHQDHRGEVVVDHQRVEVAGPAPADSIQLFGDAALARGGKVVVGHVVAAHQRGTEAAGRTHHRAADVGGLLPQVGGALRGGDDRRAAVVGLHAEVEQPERVGDQRALVVILDGDRNPEPCFGIVGRHEPSVDRHFRVVVDRRAVLGHVAPCRQREHLPRRLQPVRHRERHRTGNYVEPADPSARRPGRSGSCLPSS